MLLLFRGAKAASFTIARLDISSRRNAMANRIDPLRRTLPNYSIWGEGDIGGARMDILGREHILSKISLLARLNGKLP